MKKKISLVLSIILAFTFFSFLNPTSVRAKNLNDTTENSAKFGTQLLQPENGWKRYDDTNSYFQYNGESWVAAEDGGGYEGSYHVAKTAGDKVLFKFYGTRFRIITNINKDRINDDTNQVKIDGTVASNFNEYSESSIYKALVFESLPLSLGYHTVEIEVNGLFVFDAIDIDEKGELKPYVDSITLDKSSISLVTGKSEPLIATVKPDNTTNKEIEWSSSDKGIAEYKDGKVVASKKIGTATITAKVKGTDLKVTCEINVTEDKSRSILAITMVNGITKEYDVSPDEISAFEKWFDSSNGKGQVRYGFNKKINPYKTVKEYVVFDKIASFEIRSYEADK
ncbi:Uncharacterized conserved protein YjdB, contains Ig-like domain [Clostridium cavendishii DSM 21758]|uniref:Uncharacterized conserved protein YjdB, contains Ig-like domain n=1 Tax=Clostridium cavendishii DSM 21758 TaxID=1121302 RepID=A0A1M6CSA0_9CLOT|nr:Ig-like domain-containing protein [Clostridium cavendishii]SHI63866.1 Uncharacterized conserved protein YjdB, contains Ig-like domain [Clostridium cavendishii DSM 21758]